MDSRSAFVFSSIEASPDLPGDVPYPDRLTFFLYKCVFLLCPNGDGKIVAAFFLHGFLFLFVPGLITPTGYPSVESDTHTRSPQMNSAVQRVFRQSGATEHVRVSIDGDGHLTIENI